MFGLSLLKSWLIYLIFLFAVPVFVLEFLLNFHQALLLFDESIHTIILIISFKANDRITELSITTIRGTLSVLIIKCESMEWLIDYSTDLIRYYNNYRDTLRPYYSKKEKETSLEAL